MKSFLLYTLIIIVLLTGCSKQEISENTQNSAHINVDESKASVHDFTEDQLSEAEVTELENLITPMEMETPEINYTDMEQDLLSVYTEPIKND
jgi:lipoprotein